MAGQNVLQNHTDSQESAKLSAPPGKWRWLPCVAPAIYLALAVALTWPLAQRMRTALPLGTESVATVPLLNAWTIWWNADRLRHGFVDYWDAPIFAPLHTVFAFSESQPTTLAVAPLVYLDGPTLAYNVYLLGLLTLNGFLGYRLSRRIGLSWLPALFCGAMLEALPIVHWQLGVLQLIAICGPLWLLDRLVALRDRPTLARAAWLGVAAAVTYAACNYWGLFLSVLLPLACWPLLWGRLRNVRLWRSLAGAIILSGLLVSPIVWAQWSASERFSWSRELSLLKQLSAEPQDYLNPPWNRLPIEQLYRDPIRIGWTLGTGPVVLSAAALGIIAGLWLRDLRRWTLFLLLFGGLAFGLSLGPAVTIPLPESWFGQDSWSPYQSLMAVHPGLAIARSPFRFAFFVQIALALLAALFLDGCWRLGHLRRKETSSTSTPRSPVSLVARTASILLIITTGTLAVAGTWPGRQTLASVPQLNTDWIRWLRDHGDHHRPIICLPFPGGSTVEDYEKAAQFMYQQIRHHRPLVGGYTGFFPADFLNLRGRMSSFPEPALLDSLRYHDVEFVVTTDPQSSRKAAQSPALRLVFQDESAKVNIYHLEQKGSTNQD